MLLTENIYFWNNVSEELIHVTSADFNVTDALKTECAKLELVVASTVAIPCLMSLSKFVENVSI